MKSLQQRVAVAVLWAGVAGGQGVEPFRQDPLPDGVISMEAEHWHSRSSTVHHAWSSLANGNYSGGLAMQALPNLGTNNNTAYTSRSPRLDFLVEFNRSGPHVIAVRGVGPTSSDDTIHAGLNGAALTTCDRISGFDGTPRWSYSTLDGPRAVFNVPAPGLHTVNLWMREDGFIVDKIVVSANTNFLPTGLGPPESPRGTNAVPALDPLETVITDLSLSNGVLTAHFAPLEGVERYDAVGAAVPGGGWSGVQGAVSGFSAQVPLDGAQGILAVTATPANTNEQLASLVLNRLAYGPTPDEWRRLVTDAGAIGGAGYIAEQMAPELIFETVDFDPQVAALNQLLAAGRANLPDLQAWHLLRAVGARRQLLETLLQFWDNHFTTYYWKSYEFFRDAGHSDTDARRMASQLEYDELLKWRAVLLDPNGTFGDLLTISAESPAMIIYLDSVLNVASAPNENYAREILELFCMGVGNGYDQSDIEDLAPAWTGWNVARVAPPDAGNPHAVPNTNKVVMLAPASTGWQYRRSTNQPPVGWQTNGFVPGADWTDAQGAIGYGYSNQLNTALSGVSGVCAGVYLRTHFVVTNLAEAARARLRLLVDDGCVVYLNGQEILRYNCPAGGLAHTSRASATVSKASWQEMSVTNLAGALMAGTNLFAAQLMNVALSSSDLILDAEIAVPPAWSFNFNPALHNPSNKIVFAGRTVHPRFGPPHAGSSYALALPARGGTNGIEDGRAIVAHLKDLPYTQEYISYKLCRLFVHEDFAFGGYYNVTQLSPEDALLKACMDAWETPGPDGRKGNIRQVLAAIFQSPLFRGETALRHKIRTPLEFAVATLRALRADLGGGQWTAGTDGYDLIDPMWYGGMELFARVFPDGWSEDGSDWIDTGTMNERMRFVANFCMATNDPLKNVDYGASGAGNWCKPVELLQARVPSGQWSDAAAVADFFLGLLLPGEGRANRDLERQAALDFLNSDDTGVPGTSPFASLGAGTLAYDQRIRSLVALLLSCPKFHEQ